MKHIILSALLCGCVMSGFAQGTAADYNRAYQLRDLYSSRRVYNNGVQVHWEKEGHKFWYSTNAKSGTVYYDVDPATGSRTSKAKPKEEPNRQPRWGQRNDGEEHYWSETDDERKGAPVTSPDGTMTAYKYGNDIVVKDIKTSKILLATHDASDGDYYSAYIQFSPDSRKLAVMRIADAPKHYIYYVEAAPKDQFQPKLHKQEYQKPGDALPQRTPVIFDIATGRQLVGDYTKMADQYGVEQMRWTPDSREVTFEYNQRGHKVYALMGMNAQTGDLRTIAKEEFPKYVNWTRQWRHYFEDGKRLLWSSERDNYNHLYLYDMEKGKVMRQVTKGNFYVHDVQRVDEKDGVVYFSANGRNAGEDPYNIHYYRIGLDGKNLVELTPDKGNHRVEYSPDFQYLVDTYSSPTDAPVSTLRSATDGHEVMALEKADISEIQGNGWKAPQVFAAKGRDGKTDMWGLIFRPSNYDPTKKYPVIDYIYSGPGDQYVPKSFQSYNWYGTSLAELGFIVVMVDGMTTSFRTKEFEEVCYKNLYDSGLPDHMAWIRAAAAQDPAMDLDNIGIYGCSAGGQEAMSAIIQHPDFYKAAFAASGCHDNRMDKIWWNEQWMGAPIDSSYIKCSNIENAPRVNRPLMLCWGELDDNVDPATTMKVIAALQAANKDFEMIVLPGAHHTMGEMWGEHKRYDFFVKNLMHKNPPLWNEVKSDVRW